MLVNSGAVGWSQSHQIDLSRPQSFNIFPLKIVANLKMPDGRQDPPHVDGLRQVSPSLQKIYNIKKFLKQVASAQQHATVNTGQFISNRIYCMFFDFIVDMLLLFIANAIFAL